MLHFEIGICFTFHHLVFRISNQYLFGIYCMSSVVGYRGKKDFILALRELKSSGGKNLVELIMGEWVCVRYPLYLG